LRKENLHQLCVLIEDVYADRKNIVESVRNRVEQSGEIQNRFRNHEYELARSKFLSLRKEINHRLNFSGKQVFGDDHWLELLTRSCELNRKKVVLEKANSIHKTLINSAYSFNYEEYISLSEKIKETNTMYFKVDRTAFIFDTLNPHIFTGDISTQQLFESLEGQYNYSAELEKMILLNISNSNDSYNSLSGIIKTVVDILSVFLPKFKAIRKQKKKTIQDYQTLASFCEKHNYCSSAFMNLKGVSKIDELLPSIQKIKQQTSDLLLHKNVFQNYDNYRRLFEQQEEKTQSIIAALISTNSLDWFDIFETYYINQVVLKTAMENGIRDNTEKLYNELKEADILLRQKLSEKINFTWHEVIEEKIKTRDLSEVKYLYNQRKNKQFASRNSLRKIIHEDFEFFSTLFPVIMLNPSVSTSVLPLQQNLFDFIILDEASQLRLEDTFSSLLRGQTKIVSGDKHQMPPSNFFANDVVFWNEEEENDAGNFLAESRSLLEYADDADYKNSYLDYHYRSLHPDLIQFSNHAFYNSRLIPLPEKKEYTPIHYYNVEGTYGEGMNPQEAAEIVRFIYQCKKIDDEYPSIGIATFNIYQRDLIYDMLYEEAYGDKEKNDQLQSLLNKGLFVKNLENIQGDERDIMILSTTFGKDIHGRFRQSFGPLTQEKGYQLLNVIITRAKHSMYVFTSIPENIFLNFGEELSQKGNTGKSIFYAYLSYVKACYENDESQKMFIESMLEKNNAARILKNVHDGNIFKDLVFGELKKVFKEELIQNYKLGGFNLDLVILKDDKPFLHIDFENTQNYLPEVTYRIKLHKEKMVTGYGISTYHLWSYSWWRDSEKEIENISSVMNT
ncbi:MAG: hypothetical protein JWN78_1156, partial [Bacteroidota bacterium]|nr:hypothetical protein [Bacteroidota bacterium]